MNLHIARKENSKYFEESPFRAARIRSAAESGAKISSSANSSFASNENRATRRLQKILQVLPAAIVVLDNRGVITECNALARDMLGQGSAGERLEGVSWRKIISEQFSPRIDDGHEISLRDGRRVSLTTRSLDDEPGQLILLTDLTETRKLQHQVSRNERLTAMGRMVSSLAHQIRTPLSAALLYAGNLKTVDVSAQTVARFADKIHSRLINIERQIRDMLIFARGETTLDEIITTDALLSQFADSADELNQQQHIQLRWSNEARGARLMCNSHALNGAMLNLLENAIQAGTEDNVINISITNVAENSGDRVGYVKIELDDNGPPLDPEVAKNVTEAFVTTKTQGTGLGLAVARMIASAHKGEFFFEAKPTNGVKTGFILPLACNDSGEATKHA